MSTPKLQRLGKIARWLFIASLLWAIPSFWFSVDLNVGRRGSFVLGLMSGVGSVYISVGTFANPPASCPWYINTHAEQIRHRTPPATPTPGWEDHGNVLFGYSERKIGGVPAARLYHLILPFAQLFFALVAGIVWFSSAKTLRLRRIRAGSHTCIKCGYDLHASPERCPECGTKVVPTFTWFEPQWSFTARRASPTCRAQFKKSLWAIFMASGVLCIIACTRALLMPADHPTDASGFIAGMIIILCGPMLAFFIVRSLTWRSPPLIVVDETGIKYGPDLADPPNQLAFSKHIIWERIRSAQIIHDELSRPLLKLVIRPLLKSNLPDYRVTRAIAPEMNLEQLQLRLAVWLSRDPT